MRDSRSWNVERRFARLGELYNPAKLSTQGKNPTLRIFFAIDGLQRWNPMGGREMSKEDLSATTRSSRVPARNSETSLQETGYWVVPQGKDSFMRVWEQPELFWPSLAEEVEDF